MKNQDDCRISAERKSQLSTSIAVALAALVLVLPGVTNAQNTSNPIPGVDIIVKKNPGPSIPVNVPTDASGRFSLRLTEPGSYTIMIRSGDRASARGTTYDFIVGDRGVVVSGQIPGADGLHVASGDVTGDGAQPVAVTVTPLNTAPASAGAGFEKTFLDGNASIELRSSLPPPSDGGLRDFKIADNESPRPMDRAANTAGSGVDDQSGKLPVKPGDPIGGTAVVLEGDLQNVKASTITDEQGAFRFTRLPRGTYKLSFAGQPSKPVIIGTDGTVSGKLKHGSGGTFDLVFDKNLMTIGPSVDRGTLRNPVIGPGGGNVFGGGLSGGVMSPGIPASMGGAMGPGGPMAPGGAIGGGAMGRR